MILDTTGLTPISQLVRGGNGPQIVIRERNSPSRHHYKVWSWVIAQDDGTELCRSSWPHGGLQECEREAAERLALLRGE